MIPTPHLALQEITVRFGALVALDGVSLEIPPGARLAVVGENGAGKSTLMKVLFGLLTPDQGTLFCNHTPTHFTSPRAALAAGIGMVQQHFDLIGPFTVWENIVLGQEPTKHGRVNPAAAQAQVRALMDESGLLVSPTVRVEELSVAAQQRVEILKALYRKARVLILDEPTATLAPTEARELWAATRRLSDAGVTVVFITHKLTEVMEQAERVLVLRRGKPVLTTLTCETTPTALAHAMVGGDRGDLVPEPAPHPVAEGEGLVLSQVSVRGGKGELAVDDITLHVAPGEIVGLAGVDGSGQSALLEAIVGLRPVASGTLSGGGAVWTQASVRERRHAGLAFIPEDRHRDAVVASFSLRENAILGRHREPGLRGRRAQTEFLAQCVQTYDVRGAERPESPLAALSGGNQQKLVLARELSRQPKVVVAAQPTRGLDFSATAFVHQSLRNAAHAGAAVFVQSLDLTELLSLSDRIAVLFKGKLVGVLSRAQATEERLGELMTGAQA